MDNVSAVGHWVLKFYGESGQTDKLGQPSYMHAFGALTSLIVPMHSDSLQEELKITTLLHDLKEDHHLDDNEIFDILKSITTLPDTSIWRIIECIGILTHKSGDSYAQYIADIMGESPNYDGIPVFAKYADVCHNTSQSRMKLLPRSVRRDLLEKYSVAKITLHDEVRRYL